MAGGEKLYQGLAVPAYGESTIRQTTAATDILTIQRITGGTGDFLVLKDADGTEKFVINSAGEITAGGGLTLSATDYINVASAPTTAPTTGLVKGDMFVVWGAVSKPNLGICVSTAAQTIKYVPAFATKTLGRSSAT